MRDAIRMLVAEVQLDARFLRGNAVLLHHDPRCWLIARHRTTGCTGERECSRRKPIDASHVDLSLSWTRAQRSLPRPLDVTPVRMGRLAHGRARRRTAKGCASGRLPEYKRAGSASESAVTGPVFKTGGGR